MPHHQNGGHGYVIRTLTNKANGPAAIAAIKGLGGLPAGATIKVVSLMADGAAPGNPGDTVITFVDTTDPAGSAVAEQHVRQVAQRIDGLGYWKALGGLAHHWTCYSDM